MSAQELLAEIHKLPAEERRRLLDTLSREQDVQPESSRPVSEDEIERILLAKGIIGEIPPLSEYSDEDENFEPIEVPANHSRKRSLRNAVSGCVLL